MKQKNKPIIIFPKKQPKTISEIYKWHKKLLETTIYLEFKKKILKAAIERINQEFQKYIKYKKENENLKKYAELALSKLNILKNEFGDELEVTKLSTKAAHDTNELIIAQLVKSFVKDKDILTKIAEGEIPQTNLLHEPGWLTELLTQEYLEKQRHFLCFITFGTIFDGKGFDLICIPKEYAFKKIKWQIRYPRSKQS
ncbi:MAG: hypothetical protein PHO28_04405 [Candidatus Pacebacteria bacterium]|nr:hypothetical protein [Candidatus Paceibacterota bacterium]